LLITIKNKIKNININDIDFNVCHFLSIFDNNNNYYLLIINYIIFFFLFFILFL